MTDLVAFSDWARSAELPEQFDDRQLYLDFRAVFVDGGATPQQARRTLATLFYWGKMWGPSLVGSPLDPLALAATAATQDLCKQILTTITQPPSPGVVPETEEWEI